MRTRHSSIRILAAIFVSAVGASAYELNGPKWGTHQVPYYINPVNSDMSEDAAVAAIQAGVMAWSAQSNANILPYYMGRTTGSTVSLNGRSEIFFRDVSAGGMYGDTTWWYDSSYRLIEADIVFYDGGVTFFSSSGGCSGGVYLEDATTHEFGHALGLGHSSDPGASMYHTMQWCSSDFRTLDSDDLAGIEALYPSVGSSNATPIVTVTAPTIDAFTEGTSVTFAGSSSDKEDGDISDRLVWMSSIDGQIGTGSSFARALSLGSHLVTASASDSGGLTATKEIIVTVTSLLSPSEPAPASSISLFARAYKVRGWQRVDLTWSGATTTDVTIYRDEVPVLTTPNDGEETDRLNAKGGGSHTYRVCEAGTSVCSSTVIVNF